MPPKINASIPTSKDTPRMLMGCDLLDLATGGEKGVLGMPYGTILNIIGDKSAGKTFLKNEIIAAAYNKHHDGVAWFSDDTESGDTFDTSYLYGVDIHPADQKIGNKTRQDSETVEEMDANVSMFLENLMPGTLGIYAVDSLDGLADNTRLEMETKRLNQAKQNLVVKDPGDYGAQIAKFLSQQFFRTKHAKLEKAQCSLIIVSQIRDKFNSMGYGRSWEVSCGKALEFYSHTRIFLKTIKQITRGGDIVGAYVEASCIKSKTPRPYRKVRYTVYFDYGIDNIGSNIDYLFDLRDEKGDLKGAADNIPWDGKAQKNLENLTQWLKDNNLLDDCRADKKSAGKGAPLSVQWITEWATATPERKTLYDKTFGVSYTRDELIDLCDHDKAMAAALTKKVQEKWEAHENEIKTKRTGKYA